jgi:hypothetical protein
LIAPVYQGESTTRKVYLQENTAWYHSLSEVYELTPTMLNDRDYNKIEEWRMV